MGTEGAGVAFWVAAGVKVFHTSSFFFSRPSRGFVAVGALVATAGAAGTVTGVAIGTSRAPACYKNLLALEVTVLILLTVTLRGNTNISLVSVTIVTSVLPAVLLLSSKVHDSFHAVR